MVDGDHARHLRFAVRLATVVQAGFLVIWPPLRARDLVLRTAVDTSGDACIRYGYPGIL